jgi:hypothetical protein
LGPELFEPDPHFHEPEPPVLGGFASLFIESSPHIFFGVHRLERRALEARDERLELRVAPDEAVVALAHPV